MARKLLELPDLELYVEVPGRDLLDLSWEPEERVVSYLYNDETDHVIVVQASS